MLSISIVTRQFRHAMIVICCGILSACATINTGSHYDETTNFTAYQTFSWIGEFPYIGSEDTDVQISPLTQAKIQQAIQAELMRKGYEFLEDSEPADFVVAYTIGARDKIRVTSYPVEYHGPWGWHVPGSYYDYREYRQHTYTQGTLGVDIFDGPTNKPVWHGWAEKTITESDRKDPTSAINEGVALLFQNFPQ